MDGFLTPEEAGVATRFCKAWCNNRCVQVDARKAKAPHLVEAKAARERLLAFMRASGATCVELGPKQFLRVTQTTAYRCPAQAPLAATIAALEPPTPPKPAAKPKKGKRKKAGGDAAEDDAEADPMEEEEPPSAYERFLASAATQIKPHVFVASPTLAVSACKERCAKGLAPPPAPPASVVADAEAWGRAKAECAALAREARAKVAANAQHTDQATAGPALGKIADFYKDARFKVAFEFQGERRNFFLREKVHNRVVKPTVGTFTACAQRAIAKHVPHSDDEAQLLAQCRAAADAIAASLVEELAGATLSVPTTVFQLDRYGGKRRGEADDDDDADDDEDEDDDI